MNREEIRNTWDDDETQQSDFFTDLPAEVERLQTNLSELLCTLTGGRLSKTTYSVQTMVQAIEEEFEEEFERQADEQSPAPQAPAEQDAIAAMARDFSLWLNSTYAADVSKESVLWRRVTKICQEAGEVHEALGAFLQENPRKAPGPVEDVLTELADCICSSLGAIEHLIGHSGRSMEIAMDRMRFVCERAGVRPAPSVRPDTTAADSDPDWIGASWQESDQ